MKKLPKNLIKETKAIIRLNQFLREEIGLKENLSAKDLRGLLSAIKNKEQLKGV